MGGEGGDVVGDIRLVVVNPDFSACDIDTKTVMTR